ncbi:PqiB family protein [Marinobacterium lutimaris]|uniref:Paraquat-inducible protein B n=1 Tax=Marinobacterium lutimaris TaxID=568106 RepID=A0A1H6DMJ6_9GAMM|nr:MlaD family protein [Marinobacterium lutimaris]SEG86023.1 Paraquat-inducible protein B [Marinobacterium lutimaris]
MDPKSDTSSENPSPGEIRPRVRRHRGPSAVWILPLLAAMIAGWLVLKSYNDAGVMVDVVFSSAEGLEENKTQVIYRGLPSGTVRSLRLNDDLQSVTARIEIATHAESLLHEKTQFWLVKPQISLSGVRGLETLVSGHYIGIRPGDGPETRQFVAADEPPPAIRDQDGLYITLFADSVNAVRRGSPVYYRDVNVGEVIDYRLSANDDQILVDLYVEQQYAHLVKKHSRFWNASSLEVKGKFPDIDFRLGSLATIIAGGVHFYTPDPQENPAAEDGDQFRLFADYEAAEDGVPVQLTFPADTQLSPGTEVRTGGVRIGRVRNIKLSDDFQALHAQLLIDPRARPLLRAGSRFWLVEPSLSSGELNLQKLLGGQYIELAPGPGSETFRFTALAEAPARLPVQQGMELELISDELGSINRGSPLLYRQLPVGEVNGYELTADGSQVLIHAVIKEKYRQLIGSHTRFWNSSGIRFAADLDGVSLETGSAQTLIRGGISLFNPGNNPGNQVVAPRRFNLYTDRESATESGDLDSGSAGLKLTLEAPQLGAVAVGSPVLYRGLEVGEVSHYRLGDAGRSVLIDLTIAPEHSQLLNGSSRFWISGGIEARASLQEGVQVNTGSLKQLVKGGIAFDTPEDGDALAAAQHFRLYPDRQAAQEQALQIQISFSPGAELPPGAAINYRGQQVGRIDSIRVVSANGARIAKASLFHEAAFLAREGTRFWINEPQIRLSGILNPTNVLFGNQVEALPGDGTDTRAIAHDFIALREPPAYQPQPGLTVELHARELGSIGLGSPVLYRQVPVGEVTGYEINLRGDGVKVYAHIRPSHATLVRSSSRFFNESGVKSHAGLFSGLDIKLASLETLVGGGVSFTTDDLSAPAVKELTVFRLDDEAPPMSQETQGVSQ